MKFLKWTVEFEISETWVADGFEMTDDIAHEMLSDRLGYAYDAELRATVVKAPSKAAIRRVQEALL